MGKAHWKKEHQAQKVSHQETPVSVLQGLLTQRWTVLFLISLPAFIIFSNTFSASFHFDDFNSIADNPWIKNFSNLLDLSGSRYVGPRYVGYLSFALNYYFGKLNVFGYHLANLLIHITNGVLVYLLIRILFNTPRMQSAAFHLDQSHGIALATSLLFMAHPIQTQAVTYIVQRFTSLATLFYLLAVLLYLKWRLAAQDYSGHQSLYYAGALLSTILAMKTKEIALTLPFMLLLIEAVFFGSPTRKQWIALIPFLLTLAIIPISRAEKIGEGEEFARETTSISRLDYLFTQFNVLMTYLRLLILPVHQNLDYDYPISHSLWEPKVLFSFLFLLVLFTFSLYLLFVRSRASDSSRFTITASRLVGFGILWFFLTLSIESSIIPIQDVIFEHRLYLPSVGLLLAGSVLISALLDRWRWANVLAISLLVVIFSIATYQRNLVWKDEFTLWSDVVQKSPNKARGHINLGTAHQGLEHLDKAIQEYKVALALDPNSAEAHYDLGTAYKYLGRPEEAIREYQAAITLKPDYAGAHNNLGNIYLILRRPIEALQEFKIALTLDPYFAEAHNNLGNFYKDLRRLGEASQEYKKAIALDPNYADAYYNLGLVYLEQERVSEALTAFQEVVKLKPDNTEAHFNLGQAYQRMGRTHEATHEFERTLQLRPNYEPAHRALKSLH